MNDYKKYYPRTDRLPGRAIDMRNDFDDSFDKFGKNLGRAMIGGVIAYILFWAAVSVAIIAACIHFF